MNRLILLALILHITSATVNAQEPFIYGEIGGGGGGNTAIKFGLNSLFLKDNIVCFDYYYNGGIADNIPADYRGQLFGGRPRYSMNTFNLLYGKMFSESPFIRVALKGGLSMGIANYPNEYIPRKSGGMFSFGTNYTVAYKHEFVGGLLLNPVVELPFTSGWGMAVGLQGNINSYKSFVNLEITTIFGKIRDRRKEPDFE